MQADISSKLPGDRQLNDYENNQFVHLIATVNVRSPRLCLVSYLKKV